MAALLLRSPAYTVRSAGINPTYKEALFEAYNVCVGLLGSADEFFLTGGAALLALGGRRSTNDVDVIITAASLTRFERLAAHDARFSKDSTQTWSYTCAGLLTADYNIPLEFLQMGGGFAPVIRLPRPVLRGLRPGLGELAYMKAMAADSRGARHDFDDLMFLLDAMAASDERFAFEELDDEDVEIMQAVASSLGGEYRAILERLLKRR
jgi:hypothetical protein